MISERFFGETHDNPLPPKKKYKKAPFFSKIGGLCVFKGDNSFLLKQSFRPWVRAVMASPCGLIGDSL